MQANFWNIESVECARNLCRSVRLDDHPFTRQLSAYVTLNLICIKTVRSHVYMACSIPQFVAFVDARFCFRS